jgi:hypothetical protein
MDSRDKLLEAFARQAIQRVSSLSLKVFEKGARGKNFFQEVVSSN